MSTAITSNRTMSATIIPDNALLKVGNDGDGVIVLSSAGVAANTALTSVLIGTPVAQAVAANSLLISNITASGDIAMYGNKGGHSQQFLFYDSSAGDLSLGAASGASVDIYVAGSKIWDISASLMSGNAITMSGNLTFSAALDIVVQANTAFALEISDGTTKLMQFDSRTTANNTAVVGLFTPAITLASATSLGRYMCALNTFTLTLTGTTTVTALNGLMLLLDTPTITDTSAVTVTTASNLYVKKVVAAGSVTITNNYIINTDVTGCYLTSAGIWTDASNRASKTDIKPVDLSLLPGLLDTIEIVSFRKREGEQGQVRFGIIADDAPECMRMGDGQGAAAIYMAGVALYAVKSHEARIRELEAELALLKGA